MNSKKNINYKELIFTCLTTPFRAQGVTEDNAGRGLQDGKRKNRAIFFADIGIRLNIGSFADELFDGFASGARETIAASHD